MMMMMSNIQRSFLLLLIFLIHSMDSGECSTQNHGPASLNRSSFPAGFVFGTASSAYQIRSLMVVVERLLLTRTIVIRNDFQDYVELCYRNFGDRVKQWITVNEPLTFASLGYANGAFAPGRCSNCSGGNSGTEPYIVSHHLLLAHAAAVKLYRDKYQVIAGVDEINDGKISLEDNMRIEYYKSHLSYVQSGIMEGVNVRGYFAWSFLDNFEWSNGYTVRFGTVYVDYEDGLKRVKHWATMNEPYSYSNNGYNGGTFAPGRCSSYMGNCTAGDSSTEPYIVAHNLLLSHAVAVKIYKTKYQAYQKGQIGITIVTNWFIPKSANSVADQKAVYRMLDFLFGWFADPIIHGDYPNTMRTLVGNRLPKFTAAQSNMLKGSIDFLGVNYYTTNYAAHTLHAVKVNMSYSTDPQVTPSSLADANNESLSIEEARKDGLRIKYYHLHLSNLLDAIKEGVNVKGYYGWSFFDDFEWDAGYTVRFGMIYVDYKNNLKRYLKYSAYWFQRFLLH
ncbi:hypothetical protein LWI29_030952 [Acer saccharum]|uniref:Beta-glucosidase n=1 Tax=Acer saccharum TaxID=4024 RepID=A0AA39RM00_ACESA|nr:hypothetical protein LWI29_030952 [Acer saccharum]